MATTLIGGVRAEVVSWGQVSGRVFRDFAPESPTFPYVVISVVTPMTAVTQGDGLVSARETSLQASLWQKLADEDQELATSLAQALDGADISVGTGRVYGCRVPDTTRLVDRSDKVVQHALTILLRHTPDVSV